MGIDTGAATRLIIAAFYGVSFFAIGCKGGAGAATAANLAKINNAANTANNVANAASNLANAAHAVATVTAGGASATPGAQATSGQAAMQPAASGAGDSAAPGASAPAAVPAAATATGTTADFVGTWTCFAAADIAPSAGRPLHLQGTGPWMVVANGDGTISMIDPNNHDQCPPTKWSVSGSTATAVTTEPCSKPDGSVVHTVRGDATLSAKTLTANGVASVSGNNPVQVSYSLRCAR